MNNKELQIIKKEILHYLADDFKGNQMEEDIKIAKEFLLDCNRQKQRLLNNPYWQIIFADEDIQAIENILNRLEQDERVIEKMAKHIDTYTYRDSRDDYGCDFEMQTKCTCNHKDCNKCIIDHFRKKC